MLSIDNLRTEAIERDEVERHYNFRIRAYGLTDIKQYPLKLVDYAVNYIELPDIDGKVYLEDYNDSFIGVIKQQSHDSVLPFTFYPFRMIESDQHFIGAFDTSKPYVFTEEHLVHNLGTGFNLILEVPGEEDRGQLDKYTLKVLPYAENYHEVTTNDSTTYLGNVTGAYEPGNNPNIISGLLTITGSEKFNFNHVPFDNAEMSALVPALDEKPFGFKYYGNNRIDLIEYGPARWYEDLIDTYDHHEQVKFGTFYESYSNNPSVVSNDVEGITSITLMLNDYGYDTPWVLNKSENFEQILDNEYPLDNGDIATVTLRADVSENQMSARFIIGQ